MPAILKIAAPTSEPLSPARNALRAAIRDLAVAQDALDRVEQPCRALQTLIAERDRAARQLADAKDEDQAALGD
jgi:hypothetical protein